MGFMFRKTKIKALVRVMIRDSHLGKIKRFEEKLKLYSKKGIVHFGVENQFVLIRNEEWERKIKGINDKKNKQKHMNNNNTNDNN